MEVSISASPLLHRLLFSITAIGTIGCRQKLHAIPPTEKGHAVVCITQGDGLAYLDGLPHRVFKGGCFILKPGCRFELDPSSGTADGRFIVFDIYAQGEGRPETRMDALFPYGALIEPAPLSRLDSLMEQFLDGDWRDKEDIPRFRQQINLQELIAFLLEHHQAAREKDIASAVSRTIAYMDGHYQEAVTIEQLISMAGVGRWQYGKIFQSLTGLRPLDYLTGIRIRRAKELLLLTDDPLRDIARSSGFKDEYYFSRRFRQTTGLSPKQYARTHGHKPYPKDWRGEELLPPSDPERVVAVGNTLGDMLALGLRPVGADLSIIGRQVIYKDKLRDITDIGSTAKPSEIRKLSPDLILYCGDKEEPLEELSALAPTVIIERHEPAVQRLRIVAEILGKRRQAEKWISAYEKRAQALWKQFRPSIRPGETAAVFIQMSNGLYVMGRHGLSATLYHTLAFAVPPFIRAMIENGVLYQRIAPDTVPDYAGDRNFLLVPEEEAARSLAGRLVESPVWQTLPGARNGYTYVADAKWNFSDPITMERLLHALPRLLRTTS